VRKFTQTFANAINTQYAIEPILIVAVDWSRSGNWAYYCDKTVFNDKGDIIVEGRIISVPTIESILNVQTSGSSVSLEVVLDDSDEYFLKLMDNVDIHMVGCKLYLHIIGIPFSDAMELFEGHLVSDFEWSDKEKTFKFTMMTQFQNYEVGFSPEQGSVDNLKESMIGQAWPLGFGFCYKAPTVRITDIPVGITTEPMGIHDYWLDAQLASGKALYDYMAIAQFWAMGAAIAAFNGDTAGQEEAETEMNNALIAQQEQFNSTGAIQDQLTAQLDVEKLHTYVLTDTPLNLSGLFEVGGVWVVGTLSKVKHQQGVAYFSFKYVYHNRIEMSFDPTAADIRLQTSLDPKDFEATVVDETSSLLEGPITRGVNDFVYIEAGSQLKYLGDFKVRYVVNIVASKILRVYANRTFEGITRRMKVPKSYYKLITVVAQNVRQLPNRTFRCTALQFFRPLSVLFNQHWTDDVYVTYESSIGDSFQEVLTYIVRTFSLYDVDTESLNSVPRFRLNFVYLELKDILVAIKEICYQNKVAATLRNGKFYFTYLPKYIIPSVFITLNDIIEDTFYFTFTPTEQLITKMIGLWRVDLSDDKQNKVIIRYNINKYGTIEETTDYYCFNTQKAVEASMSFWMFRRGNSWKQIRITVPLKFIAVESYDIIMLDRDTCSRYNINNGAPTPAVVMDITCNDSTIDLKLELPIMLGTNTVDWKYWPSGSFQWIGNEVNLIYNNIQPPVFWDGISYTPIANLGPVIIDGVGEQSANGSIGPGDIQESEDTQRLRTPDELIANLDNQSPKGIGLDKETPTPVTGDYGGTLGDYISPTYSLGDSIEVQDVGPPPLFQMSYAQPTKSQPAKSTGKGGNAFPGYIIGGSGTVYQVAAHFSGMKAPPTTVSATCLQLSKDETIPPGTAIIIVGFPGSTSQSATDAERQATYFFVISQWY